MSKSMAKFEALAFAFGFVMTGFVTLRGAAACVTDGRCAAADSVCPETDSPSPPLLLIPETRI